MTASDTNAVNLLSFIDVLTCGLGASVLLFLVFAGMERDPAGTSRQHASDRGLLLGVEARGSVPQDVNFAETTAALRIVTLAPVSTATNAQVMWQGLPAGCQSFVHTQRDSVSFALVCPEGIDPSADVAASLVGGEGACARATLVDGSRCAEVSAVLLRDDMIRFVATPPAHVLFDRAGEVIPCFDRDREKPPCSHESSYLGEE